MSVKARLSRALLSVICAVFVSNVYASLASPTQDIWVDSAGNLIYQTPVKQVSLVDDIAPSVRVFEQFPYVQITVNADGSYTLTHLSQKQFETVESQLTLFGKRIQGDFDGDGLPDVLIQTDAGDEILVSKRSAKKFNINTDLKLLANTTKLVDLNNDSRLDFFNEDTNTVKYSQVDGLSFAINTADYVGSLPAKSNVSPSGEFTYNIPIVTGESTGGFKPEVDLSYLSSPVNGHVGVGWSIGYNTL